MPNLAKGQDHALRISWIEPDGAGHALRVATLSPEAPTWSPPATMARGDDWFVNWADVPAVSVGADGGLTAHWLRKSGADPYAYDLIVHRRTTDGNVAGKPVVLHDDVRPAEHGFASHVSVGDSTQVVWLDGRAYADGREAMTLRTRRLGPDGALGPERVLDDRTCDCCPTAAAALADGTVLAVYRDRSEDEIRDIAAVRIRGNQIEGPLPVHADGWRIEGCPVNGPALDASGDSAATAWFTAAQDTSRVRVAFSIDGGRSFGSPVRVDEGDPVGRAAIALLDDGAAVAWIERDGEAGAASLLVRAVRPDGRLGASVRVAHTTASRRSGFPRMALQSGRLVFVWTRSGEAGGVQSAYLPVAALGAIASTPSAG